MLETENNRGDGQVGSQEPYGSQRFTHLVFNGLGCA